MKKNVRRESVLGKQEKRAKRAGEKEGGEGGGREEYFFFLHHRSTRLARVTGKRHGIGVAVDA
jgi:hypothetical protein